MNRKIWYHLKAVVRYASVAQGIERRFPKPCVGCSNHLGGATKKKEAA